LEIGEFGVLPGRREAALQATEDQARKELGDRYALVEIGATATVDRLLQELMVEERLDAMIDKRIKRLLHLRGLKCLSTAPSSPPLQQTAGTARIPSPWEQVEQAISPSV
jgi:hypothetical protein